MENEKKSGKLQKFHLIYSIILSVFLVVSAVCLIMGCISIYRLGPKPFSREIVAATFSKIAIPVYIFLFLMIAGFLVDFLLPNSEKGKARRFRSPLLTHRKNDVPPKSAPGWFRYCVLGIGILFLVYGIATGGVINVLAKAAKICTECIGLG